MKRIIIAVLILIVTNLVFAAPDRIDINFQLQTDAEGKLRGRGYPDSNYVWEGDILVWEREITDEDGNKRIVKTYKKPFEIIANFKANSRIFGIEGNIEKIAVKKFGGALKGFVWLDNVSGGGEVTLPFTAPHIFIARGDRLNPELAEIFTDPNEDNYYELVKEDIDGELVETGKTRVFVKSFSGIGGAAGAPPTLIAHYKMNENTAGDNAELVTGGTFTSWTGDNPDGWTVVGESGSNPEISQVGAGEGHGGAGTGYCNLYTSNGNNHVYIRQDIVTIIGRKYRLSINIDTRTASGIYIKIMGDMAANYVMTTTGIHTLTFVATQTTTEMKVDNLTGGGAAVDVTFDDVSIKLLAVEDSSGNDHDALAQQDTSAISVAGKINTAFDFTPNDFIEIADHDDFTPALTPFSISVWVYMHDATGFVIVTKGVFNTDGEWEFRFNAADKLLWYMLDESVENCRIGIKYDTALTAYENQWIHLVATYDGNTLYTGLKLYLNGVELTAVNDSWNLGSFEAVENLDHDIWIGRYVNTYANGLIDNVMFFGVELTPDEVKRIYNNGHGTEILAEIDSVISPRRSNTSPLGLRKRYEF